MRKLKIQSAQSKTREYRQSWIKNFDRATKKDIQIHSAGR